MLESYCGKSCELCPRHESECPGCRELPQNERCTIAECCCAAGHDDCSACVFSAGCGKLADRQETRPRRFMPGMAGVEVDERVRANAAQTAKRLKILFWLNIVSIVVSLVSRSNAYDTQLWMQIIALAVQVADTVLYGVILLRLSYISREYYKAGIVYFISIAIVLLTTFLATIKTLDVRILVLPVLLAAVAGFVTMLLEYGGHSELMSTLNQSISVKWRKLRKWNLILVIVALASIFVVFIIPFLGLIAALFAAFGVLVVKISALVSLWQSAQAVQALVPPEIEGA